MGLDLFQVVGIYRLCGSAIVKKDLRRKLEGCGGDLDLNASEYPDINVITGEWQDVEFSFANKYFV